MIVGNGDRFQTVNCGFPYGGDRTGMVDIDAEVGSIVDARQDAVEAGFMAVERHAHAVGRCALDGIALEVMCIDANRTVGGRGVADAGSRLAGRRHQDLAKTVRNLPESFQTGRFDAVVVGEQQFHGTLLRA